MSDVLCAKCGEPWESYSLQKGIYESGEGDLTKVEAERFLRGEGCPSCAFGTLCTTCDGTGRYEEGKCCRNGAVLAWCPSVTGPGFKAGEFYTGYRPHVLHITDPDSPPGELGKRRGPAYIGSHATANGGVSEYWVRCPVCNGELELCTACDGTGKPPKPDPDLELEAAKSDCDSSDLDPIEILIRRGIM